MRFPFKLAAAGAFVLILTAPAAATAASAPPMTVAVHQRSGLPISYFKLRALPGHPVAVGTLDLRNARSRPIKVLLDPLDAVTATTLGSAYDVRGLASTGPTRWTRLDSRRIVVPPRGVRRVQVALSIPLGVRPGDYLSGIGVQAVDSPRETRVSSNVAVTSTERYAVGLEVQVPGARNPLVRLTGVRLKREPGGLTFYVDARNAGNAILQNVTGRVVVTEGRRVVARQKIGPGTFVTGTSIAYPIPTPREQPRQGARYRLQAVVRYPGGVARVDRNVTFGHEDAVAQEHFGGPKAPSAHKRAPGLLIAKLALALIALAGAAWWLRRHRRSGRPARRTLERALAATAAAGETVTLIGVGHGPHRRRSRVSATIRERLRANDVVCRLSRHSLLVVLPATRLDVAETLVIDLRRHLRRTDGGGNIALAIYTAEPGSSADQVLARIDASELLEPARSDEGALPTEQTRGRVRN